jgi:hypothetical protein
MMAWLKLNEIRSVIKNGAFLISGGKCNEVRGLGEGWPRKLLCNVLCTDSLSGKVL